MVDSKLCQKMLTVILSCKTLDQLDSAINFAELVIRRHSVPAEKNAIGQQAVKIIRYKRRMILKKGKASC